MCHFSISVPDYLYAMGSIIPFVLTADDGIDFYRCELLAVTLFPSKPFAAFVFEDDNLLRFTLFDDMSRDRRVLQNGLTDADIITVRVH
jgi:hypothetical protein